MSRFRSVFSIYLMAGLMAFGFLSRADAQTVRSERNVRDALRSLNSKVDDFRLSAGNEFAGDSVSPDEENDFNDDLQAFEDSLNQFDDKFQRRRENGDDVTRVLSAAKRINDIVSARRFGSSAQRDWASVRALLERLASNYQVAWNWRDGAVVSNDDSYAGNDYPPTRRNSSLSYGLTGTYRLDRARSEDPREIAESAIRDGNLPNSAAAETDLEEKLRAPDQVTIDVRGGNQITLASSNAAQITFVADGRDRTETLGGGKTLRVRSTLRGQELTVASLGGDTDYTVVFASIDGGKALRITRRITTDYLRQTIFAESIYEKVDSAPRFETDPNDDSGTYSSNDPRDNRTSYPSSYPTTRTGRSGDFVVPNGTILTGILEKDIDTKVSQNNDRFELVVQAPNQYRGAIIEGYISGVNRSGKVSGRSQITFNFERIRMRNGQTHEFAGILQSVTDENGRTVKVDAEGAAKGDSQTKETVKRGGIGAGVGAIIGAIAGGAKGAAIGAVIGGGAGAGSVVLQGKDDLQLRAGSSVTVQASSPNR